MNQAAIRSALALYLVADLGLRPDDLPAIVATSIARGATCVQLRAKRTGRDRTLALARALQTMCSRSDVPFIVNDDVEIALSVGASGVHLGIEDATPEAVRKVAGESFVIGFSPETDEQIRSAAAAGVDYVGIGPVFGTTTKADAGPALGVREFERRRSLTSLPVVAIGGIDAGNAGAIPSADGVAVSSAILAAGDPALAMVALRRARERP